jgi:competence protein ComEA
VGTFVLLREPERPALQVVSPTPAPADLKVYVSGAVAQPGVYSFREGDRVENALASAGGPTAEADLVNLNLSLRLRDEMIVRVPFVAATATPGGTGTAGTAEEPINLNKATSAELDTLPGVGPVTVGKIIDHRERVGPFQRIEELVELKIINNSTFERIKSRITAP